jgi:hypothetical protein
MKRQIRIPRRAVPDLPEILFEPVSTCPGCRGMNLGHTMDSPNGSHPEEKSSCGTCVQAPGDGCVDPHHALAAGARGRGLGLVSCRQKGLPGEAFRLPENPGS